MEIRRPRWPRTRAGQRRLVQAVMAGCVLALLPATWLRVSTADRLRTTADVPRTEVAVVFGAGLWQGEPSPYLAHRLDAAAELYPDGTDRGRPRHRGQQPGGPRRARRHARYLTKHGVPDARIVSDYAGFDTWDSCVRAKKIFGVDRAVLISQGFHIRRAVALCEAAGVDSYGVGVAAKHDVTWYYGGAREVFAAGKAALDAVLRPDPRFLGPAEPGWRRRWPRGGDGRLTAGGTARGRSPCRGCNRGRHGGVTRGTHAGRYGEHLDAHPLPVLRLAVRDEHHAPAPGGVEVTERPDFPVNRGRCAARAVRRPRCCPRLCG
ncbi:YdcF family protein [Streptomyces tricolor]|nr:YdcF family protein [Streptomyces tricolor]